MVLGGDAWPHDACVNLTGESTGDMRLPGVFSFGEKTRLVGVARSFEGEGLKRVDT